MARRNKRNWKRPRYTEDISLMSSYRNSRVDQETQRNIDELFDKKFTYPTSDEWTTPDHNVIFKSEPWEDGELQSLKTRLNDTKNLLSEFDIEKWHKHTQYTHRAGLVHNVMRNAFKVELCTQAWCKFHEIIGTYDLINPVMGSFSSVHICEAPGAFITSLNHRIKSSGHLGRSVHWQWLGNTLNPYYEGNQLSSMIDDDRFIFDTLDHWCFGRDNSGDIMNKENIRSLLDRAVDIQPVFLVTADGSVDCANNPAEQERLVSSLHYSEVVCALCVLSARGSMVLKMFTMLEDSSIALLYLINVFFDKVHVIKPVTSKPGNSEVYVVACGFKGITEAWKSCLMQFVGVDTKGSSFLPRTLIPASFISAHRECCARFCGWQIQTIEENIALYKTTPSDRNWLDAARKHCACQYVDRFRVKAIKADDKVTMVLDTTGKKRRYDTTHRPCSKRRHAGSFSTRAQQLSLPWEQRVRQMGAHVLSEEAGLSWLQHPTTDRHLYPGQMDNAVDISDWQLELGRPVMNVMTSRFCDVELLTQHNDLMSHIQPLEPKTEPGTADYIKLYAEFISHLVQSSPGVEEKRKLSIIVLDTAPKPADFIAYCDNMSDIEIAVVSTGSRDKSECIYVHLQNKSSSVINNVEYLTWVLKSTRNGDHLLMKIEAPLTRLHASFLYILYTHFSQVSVYHPSGYHGDGTVVTCVRYTGNSTDDLQEYLETVTRPVTDADLQVVSFVPIQLLHDSVFIGYLQNHNDEFLKQRINYLLADVLS